MATLKLFQKTRAAVEEMVQDTISYMVDQFSQSRTTFTVASAYGQILFVLEQLAQFILFYNEDSITELNINTATRESSVKGLVSLAGHQPTRAISATGDIKLISADGGNNLVPGGMVILPNYTRMKCLNNGLTYMLDLTGDDVRIPTSGATNQTIFKIVQGRIESSQFQGTGKSYQSFSINFTQGALIDNYRVNVFVNGIKWKITDSLLDMPYQGKVCMVRTAIVSGGIDIVFGNGSLGAIPAPGAIIKVEYLITNGSLGNIFLTDTELAYYQWIDSGFDVYGEEVDLNQQFKIQSVISPNFGSDAEPLALTRLIGPRTSRNYVLANADNYIIFLEKFNQFAIIDAYTKGGDLEDNRITYLFLVPDIAKRMRSDETYFTVPEERFFLSESQQSKIMNLLDRSGSMIMTTELSFVQPVISRFVLNIALIIFQGAGYPSEEVIRQSIYNRLSDYFIKIRRRDRIPRSDLVSIIETVDGVDSVNLTILSQKDEAAIKIKSTSTPIAIDEFGDIIINKDEIAIIRGGWEDRRGLYYEKGLDVDKPSCVNIVVKNVVYQSYNSQVNQTSKDNIKTS